MSAPRRPRGMGEEIPVRSYRMDDVTYQAIVAKARDCTPPRTVSDLTRALLLAWLDDELGVAFLGDVVTRDGQPLVSVEQQHFGSSRPFDDGPVFDHELDPYPTAPGLCGQCGEWHFKTAMTHG